MEPFHDDPSHNKVILPVTFTRAGPEVLIFNVEDVKKLRNEYNILGVLIGTLAQYPQQNVFMSVPLRLSIWEVIWLIELDVALLVDYKSYRNSLPPTKPVKNSSNFVVTENELVHHETAILTQHELLLQTYIYEYLNHSKADVYELVKNYHSFKYLKNQGFFLNPGLKFGGELVIYPDDPLKYHSYAIVKFNFFCVNDIIVGGRLASGVKKTILLLEDKEPTKLENEQVDQKLVDSLYNKENKLAFSIEWAGFG